MPCYPAGMTFRRTLLALTFLAACDEVEPSALDASATAATVEAGVVDAWSPMDASEPSQAPIEDAAVTSAEPSDAGVQDSSVQDASAQDAAVQDAGELDCTTLGLTYDNYGAEFLYLWCNFCHAKQEPTFTTPENVRLWAPAMRVDTLDLRSMPPSGNANYLRDPQRQQFANWLDCGAP